METVKSIIDVGGQLLGILVSTGALALILKLFQGTTKQNELADEQKKNLKMERLVVKADTEAEAASLPTKEAISDHKTTDFAKANSILPDLAKTILEAALARKKEDK